MMDAASDDNPFLIGQPHAADVVEPVPAMSPADSPASSKKKNPFTATADPNPFAEPEAPSGGGGGGGSTPWAWAAKPASVLNPFAAFAGKAADTDSTRAVDQEQDALQWKAKELDRRERELERREAASRGGGSQAGVNNFPKCYPLVRHDIEGDIPAGPPQYLVRMAFYCFLGFGVCLLWNWFAITAALFTSGADITISWLYACIYIITGLPGAWYMWYKSIYIACKGDYTLSYAWFFIAFLVHCAFCTWASLAPNLLGPKYSLAGLLAMASMFDKSRVVGIFFVIGMILWICETLFSCYVLKDTYLFFRGTGRTTQDITREAIRASV